MNRVLSSIYDLIAIDIVGGGILVFAAEIILAVAKKANQGSVKVAGFTQSLTGTTLNLSHVRVYGKSKEKL